MKVDNYIHKILIKPKLLKTSFSTHHNNEENIKARIMYEWISDNYHYDRVTPDSLYVVYLQ